MRRKKNKAEAAGKRNRKDATPGALSARQQQGGPEQIDGLRERKKRLPWQIPPHVQRQLQQVCCVLCVLFVYVLCVLFVWGGEGERGVELFQGLLDPFGCNLSPTVKSFADLRQFDTDS